MSTSGQTYTIKIDSSSVPTSVAQINAQLRSIGTTASGSQTQFGQLLTSFGSAGGAANGLGRNLNAANSNAKTLAGSLGTLGQSAKQTLTNLSGLGGSLSGIATAGAALGVSAAIGGLLAFGTAAVKASAQMQAYRASLTTVLGDTQKAGEAFDALTKFAAQTPFSLDQSVQGFIKLKALGLQPSERALISYGNTASAMGKDLNQMVEAVADAATGEFERLKEFGIKASKSGNDVAFTFQGVTTKIKGDATSIQDYLLKIGETNFGGAMERQMKTFGGAMSNLEDTVSQTFAKIGDAGLASSVAKVINLLTTGLTSAAPLLTGVGNVLAGLVDGFASIASGVGSAFGAIANGAPNGISLMEGLTFALNLIGQGFQVVGSVVGAVFGAMGEIINTVSSALTGVLGGALASIGLTFENGGRSWANSIVGILRAAKVVVAALPELFKAAISDIANMFGNLGSNAAGLLTGKISVGEVLAKSFDKTSAALAKVGDKAKTVFNDVKGADATIDRMLGRDSKKNGRSLAELAGAAPKQNAAGDVDKDAAKRAKAEAEFFKTLQQEVDTAKLYGIEQAKATKENELQNILKRNLNALEKSRVDTLVQTVANEKAITSIKQSAFELENRNTILRQRALGLTEDQAKIEDQLDSKREAALNAGVDINSKDYQTWLDKYKTILNVNQALEKQRDLQRDAGKFASEMSPFVKMTDDLKNLDDRYSSWLQNMAPGTSDQVRDSITAGYKSARAEIANLPLKVNLEAAANGGSLIAQAQLDRNDATSNRDRALAGLSNSGLSVEAQSRAAGEIERNYREKMLKANTLVSDAFTSDMADAVEGIANLFGGKIGKAIGGIASAIDNMRDNANGDSGVAKLINGLGGKLSEGFNSAADKMQLTPANLKAGLADLKNPLGGLKDAFDPAKGGSALKGIGSAVGGAMQGYEIGSQIGGLGKALGLKGFNTGSKIGGTIGGITGNPIIAAGASVIGGLIGTALYKTKVGAATITNGLESGISLSGNSGKLKDVAKGLGGSVQSGLADIAKQLGGSVGSFSGITIGQRGKDYRVNTDGTSLKAKKGAMDFNDDAEAAVAYAIEQAIKRGALTGLSDLAQKAIQALDVSGAVNLVNDWKSVMADFLSITDPVTAAVKNITDPLKSLRDRMVEVGASTTDLTKLDEYRARKLKDVLADQLSSLTSFKDVLNGDAGGVSKLAQLNTDLASFADYKSKIASGDTSIDQSAFTSLGQKILSNAGELYGTSTGAFQNIRNDLINATSAFADNVTKAFDSASAGDATVTAIQAQTDAMVANQVVANDLAQQQLEVNKAILEALQNGTSAGTVSINGRYAGGTL